MQKIEGSFAAVSLIGDRGILAFRDPVGLRPLILGERRNEFGEKEFAIASESAVFGALGFKILRDLKNGEAIFIDKNGEIFSEICAREKFRSCIFEFVYLARPDSMIDGISVHKARMRMGEKLAEKISQNLNSEKIDVVVPVPETSRVCAVEVAKILNVPFREGFVKNRYIGRTFIMPGQKIRQKSIRQKLSPIELEFKNKNVLLVDDSIVRGNTSKKIVEMVRECGARQVFFASAAPPIISPCVFGVDMPSAEEFVANGIDENQIAKLIGADRIFYQNLDDLISAVRGKQIDKNFCTACFDGKYPIEVSPENFAKIKTARREKKQEILENFPLI